MKFKLIAQYHPAAALHQPGLWAVMLDDWAHLPKKVNADFVISPLCIPKEATVALDTENDESGNLGAWSVAYRDDKGQLTVTPHHGICCMPAMTGKVLFHNAKWDLRVLKRNGMPVPKNEQVLDTMIAAYCLGLGRQESTETGRSGDQMVGGLGLKYLARRHLGLPMKTWEQVKDASIEVMAEYNANDSVATLLLWEQFEPQLPKHFWTIDMPMLDVCMSMEDRGVCVDSNFLKRYAESLDEQLKGIDLPLNPFSHKQVADYVYGTLGIEATKFTESKQPSVDKEVLETINDPVVRRILEYREVYKERKTYIGNYVKAIGVDDRIHCEFKQTSTATGRLSAANPNLQNVTKKTDLRKLFIAPPGTALVVVDWKQLELVTFAALVQDPIMLSALHSGRDIHSETASALGVDRDTAKTINFLMLYGGTPWKIAMEFHVPIDKAKELVSHYYAAFPAIRKYHEAQREQARTQRRITNFFGRTRRLDGMFSEHRATIEEAERQAINTPIQGTAGEIVKLAMIDLHYKHQAPIILQVHDELMFEVPVGQAQEYAHWLKEHLPTITEVNGVRFPVDVGIGANWKEAKENKI